MKKQPIESKTSSIVIVPTFNETENIRDLITQILQQPISVEVLVVDDKSPDGTAEVVNEMRTQDKRIHLVIREKREGLGKAYISGFKYALQQPVDNIITMDGDFSHDPTYLPDIVQSLDHYEVVIGSRYTPEGGTRNWGWKRRFQSRWANRYARMMLSLSVHDCTAGFRGYRRNVLETIEYMNVFSNGYSFLVETLYLCSKRGFNIHEIPIIFVERRAGSSKISKEEIYKGAWHVLKLALTLPFRIQSS